MSLSSAATAVTRGLVRALSHLRGERVIHAKGTTVRGVLRLSGADLGAPLLDTPGEHPVLLRLSRSLGLPGPVGDPLGLAVRVLDAYGPGRHQDLLLTTGAAPPVLRRLPLPRTELLRSTYSSLLPYDVAGRRWVLGALPVAGAPSVTEPSRVRPEDVRFRLCVAPARGPWRELGLLQGTGPEADGRRVRFSPYETGGGIAPAGWLHELRRGSYEASHVGPDA